MVESNTQSDPDSEHLQQGTNKNRQRNYAERNVRKPNEIVMTSHLDTDLSGLAAVDNDYGSTFKNAQKKSHKSHKSHGRIPLQSNSAHGNYAEPQIII